jgi:hypothetical protein
MSYSLKTIDLLPTASIPLSGSELLLIWQNGRPFKTTVTDFETTQNQVITDHINNKLNPHETTKIQVGLGNVSNDSQVKRSEMASANGVATLDLNALVPTNQLPATVINVQSDWTQSDSGAYDFIKNKPTFDDIDGISLSDKQDYDLLQYDLTSNLWKNTRQYNITDGGNF